MKAQFPKQKKGHDCDDDGNDDNKMIIMNPIICQHLLKLEKNENGFFMVNVSHLGCTFGSFSDLAI